jgi:ABC-2 type transport system permease protein
VAPVSRAAIVFGKVLGGTSVAVLQACLFIALGPLLGMHISLISAAALFGVLFLVGFGLTSMGFCFAWGLDSVQGFHAIMMVLLMPMWLLSGAFFPARGVPMTLQVLMGINPMTYGVAALRHAMYIDQPGRAGPIPGGLLSLAITILFGAACFGIAFVLASRRDKGQGRKTQGHKR